MSRENDIAKIKKLLKGAATDSASYFKGELKKAFDAGASHLRRSDCEKDLYDFEAEAIYNAGYRVFNSDGSTVENLAPPPEKDAGRGVMKIITLCGSTKFKSEFEAKNRELTLAGNIVISVACFGHSGDSFTNEQKVLLDEIHKRKIDIADTIYVINKGGYIGKSTRSEIEYAKVHGKEILYMEADTTPCVTCDTIEVRCKCLKAKPTSKYEILELKIEEEEQYSKSVTLYEDTEPIGCAVIETVNNEVWLTNFAIREDFRGKGYGQRALQILIESYGINILSCKTDNQAALHIYIKHGFVVVDESDSFSDGKVFIMQRGGKE